MFTVLLFVLFAGLAMGCAVSLVAQRNPLYSAISLVGVFIALAGLYLLLAAPFIAAVQVIVYAGAIMVLVVFVIMLLNVEEEEDRPPHLRFVLTAVLLGALLFGESAFVLYAVSEPMPPDQTGVGLTASIGRGLFTEYLLPFEITSVLLLMAIVGSITLARRVYGPPRTVDTAARAEELAPAAAGRLPGGSLIEPGQTAATGRAMAEAQIERGEAAAPASGGEAPTPPESRRGEGEE